MDKFFKISERGSNVKTEIIAGLTTFFAMAYIVITNPNQITSFSTDGALGQIWNAVYVASILVAVIGTLLMALYAKMPFAQACGMGLNSFFFVCFILPALLALLGLIVIAVLEMAKVKGSVLIAIVGLTVVYYIVTGTTPSFDMSQVGQAFKDFGTIGITGVFQGSAWKDAFTGPAIGGVLSAIMLVITFCLVDMFDTIGTLYGTASQANLLDENGDPIDVDKCMTCDSVATVAGAVLGTSTCTTFVESAAGVGAGGRTGLASIVTSACFLLCLFLTPLAKLVPACATAPALIYVGVLMLKGFAKVDMNDVRSAVPAFLALIMMPLTYSISNGIGIGCIAYTLITLCTGKYKKTDIPVTVIAALFILRFCLITM